MRSREAVVTSSFCFFSSSCIPDVSVCDCWTVVRTVSDTLDADRTADRWMTTGTAGGHLGSHRSPSPSSLLSLGSKLGQWKQEVGPTVWLKHTAANIRLSHTHTHTQPSPCFLQSTVRTPLYYNPQGNRVNKRAARVLPLTLSVRDFNRGSGN